MCVVSCAHVLPPDVAGLSDRDDAGPNHGFGADAASGESPDDEDSDEEAAAGVAATVARQARAGGGSVDATLAALQRAEESQRTGAATKGESQKVTAVTKMAHELDAFCNSRRRARALGGSIDATVAALQPAVEAQKGGAASLTPKPLKTLKDGDSHKQLAGSQIPAIVSCGIAGGGSVNPALAVGRRDSGGAGASGGRAKKPAQCHRAGLNAAVNE